MNADFHESTGMKGDQLLCTGPTTVVRRISVRRPAFGRRKGRIQYRDDSVSRITRVLNPQGDRTTCSYDAGYQLTGEHRTDSIAAQIRTQSFNWACSKIISCWICRSWPRPASVARSYMAIAIATSTYARPTALK